MDTLRALFAFRGHSSRHTDWLLGIMAFALLLGLWHLSAAQELIRRDFLPTPWSVLVALHELFTQRGFSEDVLISIYRVWAAFLLSAARPCSWGFS